MFSPLTLAQPALCHRTLALRAIWLRALSTTLALSACASAAVADGPALKRLLPAGVGRGQTIEVTAQGDAAKWPVQVWTDDPHVKWEPLADKGKFRVIADGEARLGVHHVRFSDEDNAGEALRYLVSPLQEKNETEPNEDPTEAMKVDALPLVINGVLEKRGAVDTFEVTLEQGQRLVAALEANSNLKSPVDATLQVLSHQGIVLAQNLDRMGLDPIVEFQAPRKDRFLVRLFGFPETPDSTIGFAGGDNFVYRLTLASGGWVRTVKPLAYQRGVANKFTLTGVNLAQSEATSQTPENFTGSTWPLFSAGWVAAPQLDVLEWPQAIEPERTEGSPPPTLSLPSSITGTLSKPHERDRYRFEAQKAVKLSIALTSRRLGLPMDGVLRVFDSAGKQIAREDDTAKEEDARLVFQAPADGAYELEVSDAFMAGGPDWVYRIDIQPLRGEISLSVKQNYFTGKVNSDIEIPVAIERRDGFDQPLLISVDGLAPGVACEPVKADKDAKEVKLKLKATAAVRGPFRIVARQEADATWQRTATASGDILLQDFWLTVK